MQLDGPECERPPRGLQVGDLRPTPELLHYHRVGPSCMGLSVVHVEPDGHALQHLPHAADVVGVGMGGDYKVERFHTEAGELGDEINTWAGVDEGSLTLRGPDKDGIALADIKECDLDGRRLGGESTWEKEQNR